MTAKRDIHATYICAMIFKRHSFILVIKFAGKGGSVGSTMEPTSKRRTGIVIKIVIKMKIPVFTIRKWIID